MVTLKTTNEALKTTEAATPTAAKNIFKKPIASSKAVVEEKSKKKRKINLRNGYIILAISAVFLITYSILFLYPQLTFYLQASAQIKEINDEISNYDDVIIHNLKISKDIHEAAYNIEYKEVEDALEVVFPKGVDKLGIVKRLEDFATSLDSKYPPFEFNSMTFGSSEVKNGYTVTPISTSIHSSKANFDRFIKLVNISGDINSDIKIRLMEISTISIQYRGVDPKTGEDKGVDFSVKLNAFSR